MIPAERVWRIVRAASALEPDAALVDGICRSTGLSREGVRLALERHLETSPSEDDVAHLVASAHQADRVHVLLSSTVFTAALRAIAIAWAGAPCVIVRPSRREPHFAAALVRAIDDPAVTLDPDLDVRQIESGEVHVYGRMDTIERVREGARRNVRVRAHGPGMGVGVVGERAEIELAAAALASDIVAFDQRGCLSPRVVFCIGDPARARALGSALSSALDSEAPLGVVTEEERTEAARWIQAMSFSGIVQSGKGGIVGVSSAVAIPPSGRHVHVVACNRDVAKERIAVLAAHVTAVGLSEDVDSSIAPAHARVSPLGAMQRPPLDGPVDRRSR